MHIVITGASSGLGEGLARYYGATDAMSLTLVARRVDALRALASELPARTHVVQADLGVRDASTAWIDEAEAALGPIDVLINNAGIQYVEAGVGVSDQRAAQIIELNVLAPMRLASCVLPAMLARGSGAIVNIASMAAITWTPGMAHYNASKSALAAWSETLRVELRREGVHVLTVYPGPVSSPMEQAAREKLSGGVADRLPTGTPEGLARLIDRAVRKKKARVLYPRVYGLARVFRGMSQWFTDRFTPAVRTPEGG